MALHSAFVGDCGLRPSRHAPVTGLDVCFNVTSFLAVNKVPTLNFSPFSHVHLTFIRTQQSLPQNPSAIAHTHTIPSVRIAIMAFPRFIIALFAVLAILAFADAASGTLLLP
jgi:hypothetical protein